MKKYIVGGYVRDRLLGLKPKDKDYVLVGCSEKDIAYLLSNGFQQVGKDFPVFLSPNGDEYALARIERKTGVGYDGFEVKTNGVSLADDLYRRDLTINAIAYDIVKREHVDPYNGIADLNAKVLRHVSEAFKEDPLRVLRLARFKARYSDFTIDPSTDKMVREMVKNGEIDHLTKERVNLEFEKAFSETKPSLFLRYLDDIGALKVLLPEYIISDEDMNLIDKIANTSTLEYRTDYIWAVIMNHATKLSLNEKTHSIGGIRVAKSSIKFAKVISVASDVLIKFRSKTVPELVEFFTSINIRNNGGEKFLYKITEFLLISNLIDYELEEFIIKVYDNFDGTDLSSIESLVKSGVLSPSNIKAYSNGLYIAQLNKMFE